MSTWALVAVSALYLITSYDLYKRGDIALGVMFFAYASANISLIVAIYK